MSDLPRERVPESASNGLVRPRRSATFASSASGWTKFAPIAAAALPKAPHWGRWSMGSQLERHAAPSPSPAQAMKPFLYTAAALIPKLLGAQITRSAIFPGSMEPTCSAIPKVRAALIVYFAM